MSATEDRLTSRAPGRAQVLDHRRLELDSGWEAAACGPDACADPAGAGALGWKAARVPGTAAAIAREDGLPGTDLDAEDWWFRTRFEAAPAAPGERVVLGIGGVATVHQVFLNGEVVHEGTSMFQAVAIDIGEWVREGDNELAIRCLALGPLLRRPRKPRARWRTRLADGGLRFFRTMLLGRAPGFAPGPAPVGPWRPVWLERRRLFELESLRTATALAGGDGVLRLEASLAALAAAMPEAVEIELHGPAGVQRERRELSRDGKVASLETEVRVPDVVAWWPHTHGEPALYKLRLTVECGGEAVAIEAGRVGFRSLEPGPAGSDIAVDGFDFLINGQRVFVRGAVWTPPDFVGLGPGADRATLEQVRDAGMNMVRIPGTSTYESAAFHDLCDELGVLVWQDLMFANFDYPIADEEFRDSVEVEVRQQLEVIAGRPSLAVLCGNSEIEQQVAMLGLEPSLGRGELFGALLPRLCGELCPGVPYVPSAPFGLGLPFRPATGIANYYGVGGYRRPLDDARRADVKFAAECLAFANVPDEEGVAAVDPLRPEDVVVHHPRWKAGTPRDAGAGWDFDDVRDHYLRELFAVDPGELRRYDHERYLELSRIVTGEAMAAVFGEWRRSSSACGGGLVLWLRDLVPGAGWGVIDSDGVPKVAFHHLRRALAPVAVWMTDEGLGGLAVHAANDRPVPLAGQLRVTLYANFETLVGEATEPLELTPHATVERNLEGILGSFVDATWAYRFGPPAQDAVVVSLESGNGDTVHSRSFYFPVGPPVEAQAATELGLDVAVEAAPDGELRLSLTCRRLVYGMRVHTAGLIADDDSFSIEPGCRRVVGLRAPGHRKLPVSVSLTALNMRGRLPVPLPEDPS